MGFYFSIALLPVMVILAFMFFSKKRVTNGETKIYSQIMVVSIIMTSFEIISALLFDKVFGTTIYIVIAKLVPIFYVTINSLFCKYLMDVCGKKRIGYVILNICLIVTIIIMLIARTEFAETGNTVVPKGIPIDLAVIFSFVSAIYQLFLAITNRKIISSRKFTPFYLFLFFGGINFIINYILPASFVIGYIWNLTVIVMYFTIENPDMKMLEEVHKAKEISDSANEEKAMFLYNMTNDIRNITKEIESSTDNILSETDNKSINIEYINDNAREIKSSTAKFTTMTNEILDVSSIDSSNIKIYNDRYNIKLILRQLVQEYKKKAEDKNIEFRTDIVSTLPEYLYGDSVGVKKVLSTIFENSLKYTESGYIEFSVNTITKQDIARLIITIEDSGRGIKAEDIDKIFNKKEEDKDYTNLNNNLYNARKLITLMGGTIIPSSVYGKGTVIKLVLDQKIYEEDTTEKKYDKYLDKKKVLVVDDSEASIKLISKILDNSNIEIEGVSLGKECLDRIRNKEKYDLILIDEKMEPISGLELMSKLKDIKNFNIKTILMTRNNDYEYNIEYVKYGFDDYILKPLDKDKVLEKLSKYL